MQKAKRLLLCTYYWPPSGGAGVQRSLKFAKYLPEFLIDPIVLTVEENSATYPILDESLRKEIPENIRLIRTKSWEPFAVYRKLSGKKDVPRSGFANEGIPGFKEKIMRFIRGNFFLPDARKGWNNHAIRAASELIENGEIDVVLTSSPPHSSQLIGLKLKEKYHLPWIADLRDPWTDIYYYNQLYPTKLAKKIDALYERKVLEKADKVIVVSEHIKSLFLKKSDKINPANIVVIHNGFDPEDFSNTQNKKNEIFTIAYTGTIAETYDLQSFAKACHHAFIENKLSFKLQFIGSSSQILEPRLSQFGLMPYTENIAPVNHKASISYLQNSDVLLLLIPNGKNNKGIVTGKLFEYLGSRKPIVGIGPTDGDASIIIDKCDAGKVFPFGDVQELSMHLKHLYTQWQENSLNRSNDHINDYSRRMLSNKLAREIKGLL